MYKTKPGNRIISKEQMQGAALAILPSIMESERLGMIADEARGSVTDYGVVKGVIQIAYCVAEQFFDEYDKRYNKK